MRKRTPSPVGFNRKPKRSGGVVVEEVRGVERVEHEPQSLEVAEVRNDGGGTRGRAFLGKVVETISGSSGS